MPAPVKPAVNPLQLCLVHMEMFAEAVDHAEPRSAPDKVTDRDAAAAPR